MPSSPPSETEFNHVVEHIEETVTEYIEEIKEHIAEHDNHIMEDVEEHVHTPVEEEQEEQLHFETHIKDQSPSIPSIYEKITCANPEDLTNNREPTPETDEPLQWGEVVGVDYKERKHWYKWPAVVLPSYLHWNNKDCPTTPYDR
jgi:hypothetical protein